MLSYVMMLCGALKRAPPANAAPDQLTPHHLRAMCAGRRYGEACVVRKVLRRMMCSDALLRRSAEQEVSVFHVSRGRGRCLERSRHAYPTYIT